MPRKPRHVIRLSHSAIATFKRCPWAWKIAYLWGIRPKDKTESLYDGTNWHDGLDILKLGEGSVCRRCGCKSKADPDCPICQGTSFLVGTPMQAVARCYDKAYSIYGNMSAEQAERMETRRTILLYSLAAYQWYYSEDRTVQKVLASELPFYTELIDPVTGDVMPDVVVLGKIDNFFVHENKKKCQMEHKSTSSDISSDSIYWDKLRFDPQTTMYPWAMRDMQNRGELSSFKVKASDPPVTTVIYDVWRKPQIKPKKISATDAKELLTTGNYCGEHFEIEAGTEENMVMVNGVATEMFPNASGKGCQIRETQTMFGARLMQAIVADPEHYFVRREISRTAEDLDKFEQQMVNVARTMRHMIRMDSFYPDYSSCDDYGGCDARPLCYNDISVGADDVPTGYECVFKTRGEDYYAAETKQSAAKGKATCKSQKGKARTCPAAPTLVKG